MSTTTHMYLNNLTYELMDRRRHVKQEDVQPCDYHIGLTEELRWSTLVLTARIQRVSTQVFQQVRFYL